jgi:hypothetical protein
VVAWGAGTVPRSAACRLALTLDTLAREIPLVVEGRERPPDEVVLALIAAMRSREDSPPPTNQTRVRQYADAALRDCAAHGLMPGDRRARDRPLTEFERSRRDLHDFAKTLGETG